MELRAPKHRFICVNLHHLYLFLIYIYSVHVYVCLFVQALPDASNASLWGRGTWCRLGGITNKCAWLYPHVVRQAFIKDVQPYNCGMPGLSKTIHDTWQRSRTPPASSSVSFEWLKGGSVGHDQVLPLIRILPCPILGRRGRPAAYCLEPFGAAHLSGGDFLGSDWEELGFVSFLFWFRWE